MDCQLVKNGWIDIKENVIEAEDEFLEMILEKYYVMCMYLVQRIS